MGNCNELGKFKTKLAAQLRNSETIKVMLLGKNYDVNTADDLLDEHIFSHLFVDETVTKTESYIFYDVRIPSFQSHVKDVLVYVYVICHRDILDSFSDLSTDIRKKYFGNRVDKMAEAVEQLLCNNEDVARDFGIGKIALSDISIYNATDMYGRILTFEVSNFR